MFKRYQFIASLLVLCTVLLGGFGSPQRTQARDSDTYVPDQVVVRLNAASGATIATINSSYGTTTLKEVAPGLSIYLLATPASSEAPDLAEQMAADPRLLYAEVNYVGDTPEGKPRLMGAWGGTDPRPFTNQYVVQLLGLPQAHSMSRGAGKVVAVLDTGAQLDHPALASRWTSARYDFVDGDSDPTDRGNGRDDDGDGVADEMVGHGTHVAGIVHLVAPDAQIMPLRVLDGEGYGDFFSVAAAIDYAVENGASVINLSLGSTANSRMIADAIRRATQRGIVVVAAAGNENSEVKQFPAAVQCALPVTSVNQNDVRSDFSNFGDWIDFAAPGEAIYSPFPPSGYAIWSGTSMATPFVAGQAALIRALAPEANPRQVAQLMVATAQPLAGLNPTFRDKLGKGRVNIGASLSTLRNSGFPRDASGGILSGGCLAEDSDDNGGGSSQRVFLPLVRR
ncbi:MAG: S8 family serine peptidase [Chloroflexaceae bacterium]|jgi:subtilisin family serine protease|nr:S8 family serine peptidase [Chloroflexaceae bacterium]